MEVSKDKSDIESMLRKQEKGDNEVKAGKAVVGASVFIGTGIVVGAWVASIAYPNSDIYFKYLQTLPPMPTATILAITTGIGLATWAIGKHNQKKQE